MDLYDTSCKLKYKIKGQSFGSRQDTDYFTEQVNTDIPGPALYDIRQKYEFLQKKKNEKTMSRLNNESSIMTVNTVNDSVGPGSYDLVINDINRVFSFGKHRRFNDNDSTIGPGRYD